MSKRAVLATLLAVAAVSALILPAFLETDHPVMSEAWVRGVVAGVLYGTLWGGVFVVTGALLGAFAAFGAARYLGFDAVRRSNNRVLKYIATPRSQISLMLIVFASRLIPFISFDAVSYAVGITGLLALGQRFAIFKPFLGSVGLFCVAWARRVGASSNPRS